MDNVPASCGVPEQAPLNHPPRTKAQRWSREDQGSYSSYCGVHCVLWQPTRPQSCQTPLPRGTGRSLLEASGPDRPPDWGVQQVPAAEVGDLHGWRPGPGGSALGMWAGVQGKPSTAEEEHFSPRSFSRGLGNRGMHAAPPKLGFHVIGLQRSRELDRW